MHHARQLFPGVMVCAAIAGASYALATQVANSSVLVWALVIAMIVGALGLSRTWTQAGAQLAAKRVLRIGVALLGVRVSADLLAAIGWRGAVVVVISLAVTLLATVWLGGRLGLPRGLSLLIGTGTSICGASAIAAMEGVSDARDEEVAYALATVTMLGSAAMLVLPLVGSRYFGLDDAAYGVWAGASVHEVGQVVGAAGAVSVVALQTATVVKLARVALLVPAVAIVGALRGRHEARTGPLVPLFLLAFCAIAAIRSAGLIPDGAADAIATADTAILAFALAGLGLTVDLGRLRKLGWRPIALGVASWWLIAALSLVLVAVLY